MLSIPAGTEKVTSEFAESPSVTEPCSNVVIVKFNAEAAPDKYASGFSTSPASERVMVTVSEAIDTINPPKEAIAFAVLDATVIAVSPGSSIATLTEVLPNV